MNQPAGSYPCINPNICGVSYHRASTTCKAKGSSYPSPNAPSSVNALPPMHPNDLARYKFKVRRSGRSRYAEEIHVRVSPSTGDYTVLKKGNPWAMEPADEEDLPRRINETLIEDRKFPLTPSPESASKALTHNPRVSDYYVQDKVGSIADGVLDGKSDEEALSNAEGLTYVTRDQESQIVWGLDSDEFGDTANDRYNDMHKHLNVEATRIAQEQWRTVGGAERQQVLDRRARWREGASESETSDETYDRQIAWSMGEFN